MDSVYLCREQLSTPRRKLETDLFVCAQSCLMESELIGVELATAHFDSTVGEEYVRT